MTLVKPCHINFQFIMYSILSLGLLVSAHTALARPREAFVTVATIVTTKTLGSYPTATSVYPSGLGFASGVLPTGVSARTRYPTGPYYPYTNSSLTYHATGYSYATTNRLYPTATATVDPLSRCDYECGDDVSI